MLQSLLFLKCSAINRQQLLFVRFRRDKRFHDLLRLPPFREPGRQQPVRECLQSLAFPGMSIGPLVAQPVSHGTCEWLFDHKLYKTWVRDRGFLWITGKPGAGKSTLLRYLVENITAVSNLTGDILVLSFFFERRAVELQTTPLALYRSLLHQLLSRIPDALSDIVTTCRERCENLGRANEYWEWSLEELQGFFETLVLEASSTHKVWIIVDGLDEAGEEPMVTLVNMFHNLPQKYSANSGSRPWVCISSRRRTISQQEMGLDIVMEQENGRDILTYVQSILPEETLESVRNAVTRRAEGSFLWARIAARMISTGGLGLGEGRHEIGAAVDVIPQDLETLYLGLVEAMDNRTESLKLFQWLCFATRLLSLEELRWALVIEPELSSPNRSLNDYQSAQGFPWDEESVTRKLSTLSQGLVEVIQTSDGQLVRLLHGSVMAFFLHKGIASLSNTSDGKAINPQGAAHYGLSRTCLRYLAMEEISRYKQVMRDEKNDPATVTMRNSAMHPLIQSIIRHRTDLWSEFPLLRYAATMWMVHAQQSEENGVSQADLLNYFGRSSSEPHSPERWIRLSHITGEWRDERPGPARGAKLLQALSLYQLLGPLAVVVLNVATKESGDGMPLLFFAAHGREAATRRLMGTGPGLANLGCTSSDLARLLLEAGADTEAKDPSGRTSIFNAVREGNEATVRALLEYGADVEARDDAGQTPIFHALRRGEDGILRSLLEAGASVEVKDNNGRAPIFTAVEYGGEDAVRLLLEHGADVETTDGAGETPLLWAASHGGKGVARLLLEKGVDVEAKDDYSGQTPLLRAAGAWNEESLRVLLDYGASIRVRDRYGCTPLLAAVSAVEVEPAWHWIKFRHCTEPVGQQLRLATVKLLLEKRGDDDDDDDDLEARDICGRTALSYAASRGFTSVVQELLERRGGGAEVDAVDETGSTPLAYAANHWHRGAVQLLIDHGADVNARDNGGRTPLIKAAAGEEFHAGFPPPWLSPADRDPSASSSHPEPERPARRGERDHKAVIRMLLEAGADVEMRDDEGRKALSYASRNGQVKVVRLLLESGGADPEAAEETDMTPLWTAAGERVTLIPLVVEERRVMDVERRRVIAARCDRDSRRWRGRGGEYY